MNTKVLTLSTVSLLVLGCSGDTGFSVSDPDIYVVQAYLYAGEPLEGVTIKGVLPIDADTSEVAPPISNAAITVFRGEERYDLVPTANTPGAYHYPGPDLVIRSGDVFRLEVDVDGRTATAETVVPLPPTGLSLSTDSVTAPVLGDPGSFGPGSGGFGGFDAGVTVRWGNAGSDLYFPVVDNVEADPVPFTTDEFFQRFAPRFIGQPTASDSSVVRVLSLTHYGLHRVRLYHVNEEYANLYQGLSQDSRDLNEPPTNIHGALGVFAAFAADSSFFRVY